MKHYHLYSLFFLSILILTTCGLVADAIEDKIAGKNPQEQVNERANQAAKDGLMEMLGLDPAMFAEAQSPDFSKTISHNLDLKHTAVPGEIIFHRSTNFSMSGFHRYMRKEYGVRLAVQKTRIDELTAKRFFWLRQLHGDVEVYGAQYRVIANTDGDINKAFGTIYDAIDVATDPTLSTTDVLSALYEAYPAITNWVMAPSDTFRMDSIPKETAVIYPGQLRVLPAGLHPEQRHELTYLHRVDGLTPGEKSEVFLGAQEAGLRWSLSVLKKQKCTSLYSTESAHVQTRWYGTRTIPTVGVCMDELDENNEDAFIEKFNLRSIEYPFRFYLLRNRSVDPATAPNFLRVRYRTGIEKYDIQPHDIVDDNNKWQSLAYKNRGYLDTHWALLRCWEFFNQRYGRTDYAQKDDYIKVEFESLQKTHWDRFEHKMTLAAGTFIPDTDIHSVAHEYAHAVSDNMAGLLYFGEAGTIEESAADIFAMVLHNQLQLQGPKWVFGHYQQVEGDRNFSDPHQKMHPKFYEGKFWYDLSIWYDLVDDNDAIHTNSSVMNHWFYLLSEGKKGKNERGQPYEVMQLGMMETYDVLYRALDLYMVSGSNFAQARQATIQAAEDIYGTCSEEARAIGTAWFAVGVGEPYPLCKDIWLTFTSDPANGADVRIYLDSTREVTVVENDYKITKVINRPLLRMPSRWVVGNKVDGSVVTSSLPMPYVSIAQRSEAEVFEALGLALNKRTAADSAYTAEDFDREYMVLGASKLTDEGILVNKYRHPTMANTYFWSAPHLETPFLTHKWAVRFGSLAPDMSANDNIFRGFLLGMEGPEVNFRLEPHFYDVSKNEPLFTEAAVFTHYGNQSADSPENSKE